MKKPVVLCIVGPTACGKTSLSVETALRLSGEIVSADAVAVYRGLDIGSAKPTPEERRSVPHHLIDCVDLSDQSFTVSTFRDMARDAIDGIVKRGKLPIVVGGSGLYVDSVFSDMRFSAPSDSDIRAVIEKEYDANPNAVYEALSASDPITAARLHPNDKKRIVRAVEVYRITGSPFSALNRDFESAQKDDQTYDTVRVGLNMDRKTLYERIDARVDRMAEDGLVSEAYDLFDQGYTLDRYRAMQSIGYAQLYEAYCGRCTIEEALQNVKTDTRHFAKRQLTWFKRNKDTVWLDALLQPQETMIQIITELLHEH